MIKRTKQNESFFCPQNGYGFKTDGKSQYVDLGDWSSETCFVDVDSCEQGFYLIYFFEKSLLAIIDKYGIPISQ